MAERCDAPALPEMTVTRSPKVPFLRGEGSRRALKRQQARLFEHKRAKAEVTLWCSAEGIPADLFWIE